MLASTSAPRGGGGASGGSSGRSSTGNGGGGSTGNGGGVGGGGGGSDGGGGGGGPANEADETGTTSVDVEWCDDDYAPSNHQEDFWLRTLKKLPKKVRGGVEWVWALTGR